MRLPRLCSLLMEPSFPLQQAEPFMAAAEQVSAIQADVRDEMVVGYRG